MRNLSKQNRKKIFDLIKRDCTFCWLLRFGTF